MNRNWSLAAALLVMCGFLAFTGCSSKKMGEKGKKSEPPAVELPKDVNGDEVIASVNGTYILRSAVEREKGRTVSDMRHRDATTSKEGGDSDKAEEEARDKEAWDIALRRLVEEHLLAQEADKEKIGPTEEQLEANYKQITSNFRMEGQFEKTLEKMGITEEQFRDQMRRRMKARQFQAQKMKELTEPGEEEIKTYYEEHKDEFRMPERFGARHILLRLTPKTAPEEREAKRKKLEEIREKALAGADFGELAREFSEDNSKTRGGDLGFFGPHAMVPKFEEAVKKLKEGEISDVVETRFGLHIIQRLKGKESGLEPLEVLRTRVRARLLQNKRNAWSGEYVKKLMDGGAVTFAKGYELK